MTAPKLGDRARDRVTGLVGIVTATTQWISGCNRVLIQPEQLHDGKPIEGTWVDDDMAELVDEAAITPTTQQALKTPAGGPQADPSARRGGE